MSATETDLGLLYEFRWKSPDPYLAPRSDWEVIDFAELQRRWGLVESGQRSGPVSYAGPPGVLSGMSEHEALELARQSGALPAATKELP